MMNASPPETQQMGRGEGWQDLGINLGPLYLALGCKWPRLRQADLLETPRTRALKRTFSALVLCQQNCVRSSMLRWYGTRSEVGGRSGRTQTLEELQA